MEFQPCGARLRHLSMVATFDTRDDAEYRNFTREAHARDYFFPTPVYRTDLVQAEEHNARPVADTRARRARDSGGMLRSNVPQLGGWHSATDMRLRSEYTELTREIFDLIHGVFVDQGYDDAHEPVCDSMWANINPRRCVQQPSHPSERAVETRWCGRIWWRGDHELLI